MQWQWARLLALALSLTRISPAASHLLLRTHLGHSSFDACDAELGSGFLETMRRHQTPLCVREGGHDAGQGASSVHVHVPALSGDIVQYSASTEPGCNSRPESHVAILENVTVTVGRSSIEMHVSCEDSGLNKISDYERGGAQIIADSPTDAPISAAQRVEEDTILVINPRHEYFSNLYHTMEEVFSISETATLLNRSIDDFRFLVAHNNFGSQQIFQFGSQVEGSLPHQEAPPDALGGLLEMWSALLKRGAAKKKLKALALSFDADDTPTSIFFRRLVLPMRACDGSILPRSWSSRTPCEHGSAMAQKVSGTVLQAFGRKPSDHRKGRVVTLVVRHAAKRGLLNTEAVADALSRVPGVTLRQVDFAALSFAEQVQAVQESDVLVGVHGAGLTHVMLLPPGAGIVEITPHTPPFPGRSVANIFANMAAWTKHPYRAVHTTRGELDTAVEVFPRRVARAVKELLGS